MPKKSGSKTLQQTQNTCTPSWQGIPQTLHPYILNFLYPIEALPCITTTKGNIQNFGSYIIQRLRHEKLAYQIICSGISHIIAMRKDGFLIAWGYNNRGQLGLGNNPWQVNYQIIDPHQCLQGKTIQSIHVGDSHTLTRCTDGSIFSCGNNNDGQLDLGHNNNQLTPNQLPDILEQAFTEGHQRLTQHNVFFNTPDPKHRLLSGCVLQSSELAQSKTESTTTGLGK